MKRPHGSRDNATVAACRGWHIHIGISNTPLKSTWFIYFLIQRQYQWSCFPKMRCPNQKFDSISCPYTVYVYMYMTQPQCQWSCFPRIRRPHGFWDNLPPSLLAANTCFPRTNVASTRPCTPYTLHNQSLGYVTIAVNVIRRACCQNWLPAHSAASTHPCASHVTSSGIRIHTSNASCLIHRSIRT